MDQQCARGPNGELLDESKIVFYHDADDIKPISGPGGVENGLLPGVFLSVNRLI